MCCWDVKIPVTQETENLVLQQIQQAVNPNTPAAKTKPEEPKPQTTHEVQSSLDANKHILDYIEEMPRKKVESKENLNKDNEEKDNCSDRR